jgi:hypothetical protein
MVAMRSALKPEAARGLQETYEFRIDEEAFHLRVNVSFGCEIENTP